MLIGASLVMLLFAAGVDAQRPGRQNRPGFAEPPVRPDSAMVDKMMDRMAENLSLTGSQKEEIRELHYAHMADARKHQEKMRETAANHREEMEKSRQEMDKAITDVLDEGQKEKFESFCPGQGPGQYGPRGKYSGNRPGRGLGRRGYDCPYR